MSTPRPVGRNKERGVLIVAIMAGIAIMMILSTVAVQKWADVMRRDSEAEMMFRAQDICRAILRYQKDHGQYPTELKLLTEVGSPTPRYYIRQLWKDPLVKGGKWQLLYANPSGAGFIDPSAPQLGNGGLPGQPAQPGSPPPNIFGQNQNGQGGLGGLGGLNGQNPNNGAPGTPNVFGQQGAGGIQPFGSGSADPGELTGMPIVGVKSKCKDHPFRRYKDKTEYSEWVFTIFDLQGAPGVKPAVSQTQNPGATNGGPGVGTGTSTGGQFPPTVAPGR